ncbi:oxygenase MpaB family protein [Mycobacterium sp. 134]|uniref:oxygenase MpaB family protein n=1 Tax=Mycobacterium sp. 134 TaxID=3400425 RepID=UPI003AADE739
MDALIAVRKAAGLPAVAEPLAPAEDYGFFGPGSVTWKVWSYPTSLLIGFSRAVTIEHLDPFLAAAVDATGQVYARTRLRYDRTMQYFALVAFGDAEAVLDASEILVKIHSKAVGTEPITKRPFDANDPHSQLWIHLTAWHSILYSYEMFGPGKLSPAEESRYWEECARAAEFQTINPDDVPRTREGIRAYFESFRPDLVGSEVAQRMMDYLVDLGYHILPERMPRWLRKAINVPMRAAIIATMPRWMRLLGGIPQRRFADVAARAVVRPALRLIAANPRLELAILDLTTPHTTAIVGPTLLGVPAKNTVTYTPAEARAKWDRTTPFEQYAAIVAKREVGDGPAPYAHNHHDALVQFDKSAS